MKGDWVGRKNGLEQSTLARPQCIQHVLSHEVLIFLAKTRNLIFDLSRVVSDDEGWLLLLWSFVVFIALEELVEFGEHRLVSACVDVAFLINESENAVWFALEQLDAFSVVGIFDVSPTNSFLSVLLLLELEDVLIEVGLQMFVCIVDAELFE